MIAPRQFASVLFGPPGSGKTTELMSVIAKELEEFGTDPRRIGFLSYSRSACEEARARAAERLQLSRGDLQNFRTIHSMCASLLDWGRDMWLKPEEMQAFADRYSYDLSHDRDPADIDLYLPPRKTEADDLRMAYEWCRNARHVIGSLPGMPARCPVWGRLSTIKLYIERYEAFKQELGKHDYTDCLEMVLAQGLRPTNLDVLLVDEAQDLSPLQAAIVELWSTAVDRMAVAGDDDQAIYGFQGADPAWMRRQAEHFGAITLSRSYRLPRRIHAMSQRIIRQNRDRYPKQYEPDDREGGVVFVTDLEDALKDQTWSSTLVLARTQLLIKPLAEVLFQRRIPYVIRRGQGPNPLGSPSKVAAVQAATQVLRGEPLWASDVAALIEYAGAQGEGALLKRGTKKAILDRLQPGQRYGRAELTTWGMEGLLALIDQEGPAAVLQLRTKGHIRDYFAALYRQYGYIPAPAIEMGTWHWSKGREADHVILLDELSRSSRDSLRGHREAREAENRLAYVAVTRARHRLTVVTRRCSEGYGFIGYR